MPRPRAFSTLFPYTTLFRSFVKIFAVLVEDLNAMIGPIIHENTPGLGINRDAVNVVHVSRSRIVRRDRKSTRLNSSHRTISYAVSRRKKYKPASTTASYC